ncbi:MAG: ComEC family competence protein [Bacteroidetes bacterium]|nr:ComEC family competence protein [Bacteroidota bacterium]
MNWKQYPFVKILLPFSIGIIAAMNIPDSSSIPFIWIAFLFSITTISIFLSNRFASYKYRWLPGSLITLFLFTSGFSLCIIHNESNQSLHFNKLVSNNGLYIVKVTEPAEIKTNSVKAIVQVTQSMQQNKWENCNGNMVIYFQNDSISRSLQYGDLLLINSIPNEIKPPQNPSEFDYKRYLANKNVFHQSYLKHDKWIKLSSGNGNPLKAFATSLRDKLLHIFEENNVTGQEYAVTSAILLGQTDKIDPELIKEYSGSGAIHVLSVSGMHVGLIFISLSLLLSFLDKIKHGKLAKALLMLFAIWFYAMLTGMSPSVIRAAAMISFIIIGKSLRRDADTLNILLASAFFILVFNPFLIADVGFQLSYLAVGGIVLINDAITKLFAPKNYLLDKLWQTTAVSLSAQLITTPLSILYFHQFPNYFLLTNVVVFIFAGVVMYAGIFVILVSFIPYVSTISAKILVYLVMGMNKSIGFIEGLPYSVSRGIDINLLETVLIYIIIFALMLLYFKKAKHYAFIALTSLFMLFTSFTFKSYQHARQQKFIVYAVPKTSAYEFINGSKQVIITDSSLAKDANKFGFHIQNNHTKCGITTQCFANLTENFNSEDLLLIKQQEFIQFMNRRMAFVSKWQRNSCMAVRIKLDYLILSKNVKLSISDVLKVFDAKVIIFDSSNSEWKANKWETECTMLHQPFYNVLKNGAFVEELEEG